MHELKQAIKVSRYTSPDIDTVHYQLLNHLPEDSLLLLLYIFNHIWLTQDFPTSWKTAIIIPVPKPGKVLSDPGSARPSYIKRLDTVHNQGLRLCLGAFRTSPVQSLYVAANEPPLDMRRTRLSLQYGVKLMSNEVNPAYSAVFQSDIVATYEAKERDIKPLGLRIERHLDEVGFHTHVSIYGDENSTMEATVCFDFYKYKKSDTDPTLYIVYIILNC